MADGEKLKRERAGTYRTLDGRFTVEQSSSGWLLIDAEQSDDLGLPLARGPFATLDEARAAVDAARIGPAPTSTFTGGRHGSAGVSSGRPRRRPTIVPEPEPEPEQDSEKPTGADADGAGTNDGAPVDLATSRSRTKATPRRAPTPTRPPVTIRELRGVDGDGLRALWGDAGFRSLGDDDLSLGRMARRNPGLLLVATEGTRIVGSALGAWDGRRGAIYHVAVAERHRRQGIATRLVAQVEAGLRDLGCSEVRVHVPDDNEGAQAFWSTRGYAARSRLFARELRDT
ncbi:MAG TPA: GNAT family N-acetyltransferase [Candidatus Limnocylindria bacterium]|nr:GNAT family N-acetyltransferase [Candidatus Limnocylindria bacterium]